MNVMNINTDAIDEVALARHYLTLHDQYRAWKSFNWDVLNCLKKRASSATRSTRQSR
jgi:hypothetical protein